MVITVVTVGEALNSIPWFGASVGFRSLPFPPKLIPVWLLSSFLPGELCTLLLCLPVFPREKDSKYSRKDLDKLQERTSLGGRGQGVFPEVRRVPELEGVLAITYLVQSFPMHGHPTRKGLSISTRETHVSWGLNHPG